MELCTKGLGTQTEVLKVKMHHERELGMTAVVEETFTSYLIKYQRHTVKYSIPAFKMSCKYKDVRIISKM